MATIPCPGCDTVLKIPPAFTGNKARCPKCKGLVNVPWEEDVEEAVEVVEDEDSSSRAVTTRRKPRLRQDEDDEPVSRRRAPARDDDEDDEPVSRRRAPARRDDDEEEDEDPAPRKKKARKRRRESADGPSAATVVGIGLFVFALWLLMAGLGYKFRGVSWAMIIIGGILSWIGTKWILSIASEEGTGPWLACIFVPFYETWFTFTRLSRTWMPCLICSVRSLEIRLEQENNPPFFGPPLFRFMPHFYKEGLGEFRFRPMACHN